jgi:molecular chaperone DnaK (HSP70)
VESGRVRLGVDFGTAHTVAVVEIEGREPRPPLFDGSPLLPSAVCVDAGGRLLTGRDALHTALAFPESFEPHPKRCIDDGVTLLGEREVPVAELIAAPLRRVAAEAALVTGEPVAFGVLTCPAS